MIFGMRKRYHENMNTEIEDIKARLSIREVIGGYVQLTKAGTSWKGLCPFHREKSPSFIVNEERSSWHCFGCNKGGDIFSFVMEIDGLSFPEAKILLAERAGVTIERHLSRQTRLSTGDMKEDESSSVSQEEHALSKARLVAVLELATRFFEKQLHDGVGKKIILDYLHDRGLSDESIRSFRVGYALPGWRTLSDFLLSKGFSLAEIEASGLLICKASECEASGMRYYDRFRERITFPISDIAGRVIGFSARVAPGADETQAKYINTPETAVYHKSHVLYGLFLAKRSIREKGCALLVEGQMDVIALHQAGYTHAIAVSGTALTQEQLKILKRSTDQLRLFFDMDTAGQTAARKSTEMALSLGFSVFIVSIPSGKDAAEMARENIDALRTAMDGALPALDYFLTNLLKRFDIRSAEGKRYIAEEFLILVRLVPRAIERAHWIRVLSERIGSSESILLDFLKNMKPLETEAHDDQHDVSRAHTDSHIFESRSEKLGRDIASILLATPHLLPMPLESLSDRVFSFVSKNSFLSFLSGESPESFSFALIPEELKNEAAQLAFAGEAMLGACGDASGVDEEKAKFFLNTLWKNLAEELRKEEMHALERAMRVASVAGNIEEERALATRLMEIGREQVADAS